MSKGKRRELALPGRWLRSAADVWAVLGEQTESQSPFSLYVSSGQSGSFANRTLTDTELGVCYPRPPTVTHTHPPLIHLLLLMNSSHTLSPVIHRHVQDTPTWPAPWVFTDTLKPAITGDARLGAQESESGER